MVLLGMESLEAISVTPWLWTSPVKLSNIAKAFLTVFKGKFQIFNEKEIVRFIRNKFDYSEIANNCGPVKEKITKREK